MYLAEPLLEECCRVLDLDRSLVEVAVHVVGSRKMQELNLKHRGKDKATDVLSFPLLKKNEISTLKKKRGILYLGDIFINRDDAKLNFPFLVAHGFLHLMGYDHETGARDAKNMFSLQDRILTNLGHATKLALRN